MITTILLSVEAPCRFDVDLVSIWCRGGSRLAAGQLHEGAGRSLTCNPPRHCCTTNRSTTGVAAPQIAVRSLTVLLRWPYYRKCQLSDRREAECYPRPALQANDSRRASGSTSFEPTLAARRAAATPPLTAGCSAHQTHIAAARRTRRTTAARTRTRTRIRKAILTAAIRAAARTKAARRAPRRTSLACVASPLRPTRWPVPPSPSWADAAASTAATAPGSACRTRP